MKNKITLLINSIFYMIKYFILNRVSNKHLNKDNYKVIISLTCFPARINKVFYTIESLINQNVNISYDIRLYLSKDEFVKGMIPDSLKRLEARGLSIIFVEGNIRSYKKLIYVYDIESKPIITVDDDIFYPKEWLDTLYTSHLEKPCDIIYFRGRKIIFDDENLKLYHEYPQADGLHESYLTIPTGVSGILYPPKSLFKDWDNQNLFIKLAPSADDLWFKVMSLLNNRKCYLAYDFSVHFPPVLGTQSISLRKINVLNTQSPNDIQLKNLLDYYNIDLSTYK
ncbi:hypothetical protein C0W54_14365 [Photobacterium kishitanii]|uniref:hypothetical protein n=1 Tax=Photobacterium kishitanii TaxID=318456 RepID=UPI000D15980F|nr:hypothetical protein [Photobacterium kishitanii]PSW60658.1 hypothetical protein C0W54_14365 [Photobacterium kishitanii]